MLRGNANLRGPARAHAAGRPLELTTVQLDGPREGEVLVEIKATGVCRTDEFTLSGADPEGLFPAILGHEGAGVVVDIGHGVTSVKKGDNDRKAWGERFGMTHFVNPKDLGKDLVPHLVDMTKSGADQIGGADYTFDCTGNVTVMRQALEACHRGWGQSIVIGVAPSGAEILDAAVPAGDGPGVERHRVRRALGAAPMCRRSSTGTCRARSRSIR
jgi:Zn-dependent alcohol dehydrogenase